MNRKHRSLKVIMKNLVIKAMALNIKGQKELQTLKNTYSADFGITSPSNVMLIETYRELLENGEIIENKAFFRLITKRKVRSASGIANVTVLTKSYKCPGRCIFCPTEPNMPKSYLSNEPAMMRAILNDFNAKRQVKNRLMGLEKTGHPTDKIEIIVAGGTFSYYPKQYQSTFIRGVFNGLNEKDCKTLKEAQKLNETSNHRCVGLSLETRPDWITVDEIKRMRGLGATKVEIGIQAPDDKILELNKRGHQVEHIRRAMSLLKDGGFKINAHIMPNLYGSNMEKDLEMFKELFEDSDFRPDWLKIYPCVVTPYSELEHIWRRGDHKPYTDQELTELIVKMKTLVPEYVRIARLYRDIPAESILGGSKVSNIRQVIQAQMQKKGLQCRCIRCREVRDLSINPEDIKLVERIYDSSGGKEHFLSFEDSKQDKLIAFLRLRIPKQYFKKEKHFIPELDNTAIIRELHTYGMHMRIDDNTGEAAQHRGYGKKLIKRAEEITKLYEINKLAVISGIGVREYYKKLGFGIEGTYMIKNI